VGKKNSINQLKSTADCITNTLEQAEGRTLGTEDKFEKIVYLDNNKETNKQKPSIIATFKNFEAQLRDQT
jgi:hypothetical protein